MEKNKKISEMTEKEILRQQLLILAERSLTADEDELPGLTHAMLELKKVRFRYFLAFLVPFFYLGISLKILFHKFLGR